MESKLVFTGKQETLTEQELRSRLFHRFRHTGIVDSLKTQLRVKLLTEFQLENFKSERNLSHAVQTDLPLLHRISNAIVSEYLSKAKYEYTRSVFLAESSTSETGGFLREDIMKTLRIGEGIGHNHFLWHFMESHNASSKSLLLNFVEALASLQFGKTFPTYKSIECQTDDIDKFKDNLDWKLKALDDKFSQRQSAEQLLPFKSIE